MASEFSQVKEEVARISHLLECIKEAYSLRKELESIQKSVEELKNQSKSASATSNASAPAPVATPTPAAKPVTPAPAQVAAPTPVSQPKPAAAPAPTQTSTPAKPAAQVTPIATPAPSSAPASQTSPRNATGAYGKIGGVGVEVKNTSLPSSMYSKEESAAILAAKNKEAQKPEFQNFGIDADLAKKNAEKYDPQLENEAREWIQSVTGETLQGSLASSLKSGVVLCNLVNKIKPNSVKKINKMSAPFMQMENINNFLSAIQQLGVPQSDSFMTVDLYEEKNVNQVITTINSLGRLSRTVPGYTGPSIGPKLATKHEVHFTEEQLRRGQNTLNYAQESQKESGKMSSEMMKSGTDSVVRTKETGTATNSLGLMDAGKADAQKEANNARREGHNIIR